MNSELDLLREELNALKTNYDATVTDLRARIEAVESGSRRERRRLRVQASIAFLAFVVAVLASPANRQAIAQGYGVTLASLNTRVTALEGKTQFMSVDATAKSTTFSGCNLFVNDGGGSADTVVTNQAGAGLGNIIIGYNALRGGNQDSRTGSHNLILGDQQNYGSFGGLVAGYFNTISASYASVSGGGFNTASDSYSSVSGGYGNAVSALFASVSGGGGIAAGITQSNDFGWSAGSAGAGAYHNP